MKIGVLLFGAAVFGLLCGVPQATGAYAPEVQITPEQEKEVLKAQRALKSLSSTERALFLAFKLGLLFDQDGDWCYYNNTKRPEIDKRFDPECNFMAVSRHARAVLPNGKEVDYHEATKKIAKQRWEEAGRVAAHIGDHALCLGFAHEVEALVKAVVYRRYSQLRPNLRDAFRATLTDAMYSASGRPIKPTAYKRPTDGLDNESYDMYSFPDDARYKNRDGMELILKKEAVAYRGGIMGDINRHLFWCVKLIGKEEVLAVMDKVDKKDPKGKK